MIITPKQLSKERLDIGNASGIYVMSHDQARTFYPKRDAFCIRIRSANFECQPLVHADRYKSIDLFTFADVDFDDKDFEPFTTAQAAAMVDLFEKFKDLNLVVHCMAGLSRSPATALAFLYFKQDVEGFRQASLYFTMANSHVYSLLKNEIDRRAEIYTNNVMP